MRAPVINRFAKIAPLAAVVALTAGLTVLPASTAWACGDAPFSNSAQAPEPQRATTPALTFVNPRATTLTAGGPKVEFGVQIANHTGAPYKAISPGFSFWNPQSGETGNDLKKVNVRKQDFTVEVMKDGKWQPLKLRLGCDPTLSADTSLLNAPLADGQTKRYVFRIGLAATAPKEQKGIELYVSSRGGGPMITTNLKFNHPAAQPTKPAAPKATPSTAAPAAVPAAAKDVPAAAPTPSISPTATTTTELAETGSSTPNTFLLASAAAFVALGTGVLLLVRRTRRTRRTQD
ncbi:LPXTG cell wall anchor domain-containing protein [Kitasatospora sp. P5_F3]